MKLSNAVLRVVAGFLAVSVIQIIAEMLAGLVFPLSAFPPDILRHITQWMLLTKATFPTRTTSTLADM